ncbi:MAG: sensor histidine kinase, partial [Planctomycetota bacterium]
SATLKIVVASILLILLPSALLGFLGLRSIARQGQRLRTNYGATISLVRDRLLAELERVESELTAELQTVPADNPIAALRRLEDQGAMTRPFLVHMDGGLIMGELSLGWPGRTGVDPLARNGPLATTIRQAEHAEFATGDLEKALDLYRRAVEQAGSGGEDAFARARVGRTLLKLDRHGQAIDVYRSVLELEPWLLSADGVPYHVLAMVQIIEAADAFGSDSVRDTERRQLASYLLEQPWDLAGGYAYYFANWGTMEPDRIIPAGYHGEEHRVTAMKSAIASILWMDEAIVPVIQTALTLERRSKPWRRRFVSEHDGRPQVISAVLDPHAEATMPIVARGCALPVDRLVDELLADILASVDLGDDLVVGVRDDLGRARGVEEWTHVPSELVSADLASLLPGWSIALFHREGRTVEDLVRRQNLGYGVLVVAIFLLMVAGVTVTTKASAREMELSRLQSDFVSNVSHELKTPLALIRMYGETLESGIVADDEKRREFSTIIRRESERLTHLIDNVLDFGRIDEGTKQYQMAPSDIVSLVRDCLEDYRYFFDRQAVTVEASLPETPIILPLDRDALAQALVNLFQNAVKYGGDDRYVGIELRRELDDVLLSVRDRGPGIPAKELTNIFRKYYRAHRGSAVAGSGLGLSIVQHAVRAHGGRVEVDSEIGRGSVFTLRLPLDRWEQST